MGEYTGRATCGIFVDSVWSAFFLFILLIFVFVVGLSNILSLISVLVSSAVLTYLLTHLFYAAIPKKIVINDVGIFLYRGKKLIKKEYWKDIKNVISGGVGGWYPSSGFVIVGKEKININDGDFLGPKDVLKKAFIEVAEIASKMGIEVMDYWGWATNLFEREEEITSEKYIGKWHKAKGNDKSMILNAIILALIGVALSYIGITAPHIPCRDIITYSGEIMTVVFFTIFFLTIYSSKFTPIAIYFDNNEIRLKFLITKEKRIPIDKVREIRCFEGTGLTTICVYFNSCYSANFNDKKICKALKIAFKRHKG